MSKAKRIKAERSRATEDVVAVKKGLSPIFTKILIWVLVLIFVLGGTGILTISALKKNGTLIRKADGIVIDGETYKASEIDYYYNYMLNSLYSTAYSYYQSYGVDVYGIDFSVSLFKQAYTTDSDDDGTPDYDTWGDYLLQQAVSTFYSYVVLNNEAEKNGYLQQEGMEARIQRDVDSTVAEAKAAAEENDTDFASYLKLSYGSCCTEESFLAAKRRETIAAFYSSYLYDNIEITDQQMKEEYDENTTDYDTVTYRAFTVNVTLPEHLDENGEAYSDDVTKEEDEQTMTEVTKKLKDALSAIETEAEFEVLAAQQLAADGDDEDKEYATKYTDVSYSSLTEAEQNALFGDDIEQGEVFVNRDENKLSVYYFISRNTNDYKTRNFRHILLKSDEKDEAVATKAQGILDGWLAGDKSVDSFSKLVVEYTEDTGSMLTGGLIDENCKGTVVTEINDWLFDESRKEGDTSVIFSDSYGYHICVYEGETDLEARYALAKKALKSEQYTTDSEALEAAHSYKILDGLGRIG